MKIITFNIRCCDDENGHSISERAPRLKASIEKYNPDIIGLQEATPVWMPYLEEYFGNEYTIFNKYRKHDNFEGTPILWKTEKFTLIDKGYFWLSDTPWLPTLSFGDTLNRICLWVRLRETATNKEFYYFNTHFGFGDNTQVNSVELIKRTSDLLCAEKLIITGDFNMKPEFPAYKKMTEYFTDVNMLNQKDMSITFHNYGRDSGTGHIDYCFITEDTVGCNKRIVIKDTFDGKYPSDHYGIYNEIEIK